MYKFCFVYKFHGTYGVFFGKFAHTWIKCLSKLYLRKTYSDTIKANANIDVSFNTRESAERLTWVAALTVKTVICI